MDELLLQDVAWTHWSCKVKNTFACPCSWCGTCPYLESLRPGVCLVQHLCRLRDVQHCVRVWKCVVCIDQLCFAFSEASESLLSYRAPGLFYSLLNCNKYSYKCYLQIVQPHSLQPMVLTVSASVLQGRHRILKEGQQAFVSVGMCLLVVCPRLIQLHVIHSQKDPVWVLTWAEEVFPCTESSVSGQSQSIVWGQKGLIMLGRRHSC